MKCFVLCIMLIAALYGADAPKRLKPKGLPSTPSHAIEIRGGSSTIVSIDHSGKVTLGEGVSVERALRFAFEEVARANYEKEKLRRELQLLQEKRSNLVPSTGGKI